MAQSGEDPPLGEEDTVFDRGGVAGLPRAGRNHHGPVVCRQLLIRPIDARLVAAGPRDGALQLVGDQRAVAPPKYSTIRVWAPTQSGTCWVAVASA